MAKNKYMAQYKEHKNKPQNKVVEVDYESSDNDTISVDSDNESLNEEDIYKSSVAGIQNNIDQPLYNIKNFSSQQTMFKESFQDKKPSSKDSFSGDSDDNK